MNYGKKNYSLLEDSYLINQATGKQIYILFIPFWGYIHKIFFDIVFMLIIREEITGKSEKNNSAGQSAQNCNISLDRTSL